MATRFVRIDLSDEARDYRPMAIEPGVPMLDRSNANAKLLFRWVGGLSAEPVWEGESVNFYARDNRGGRLEEVLCQPASEHEFRRSWRTRWPCCETAWRRPAPKRPPSAFPQGALADVPRPGR